jgi:hypothetical protein
MIAECSARTRSRVKGNRLRKAQLVVGSDTTTIGEYEYFGDMRRSQKSVTNHGPEEVANDGGNTTVRFYYGGVAAGASPGRWSVFETRNGSNQTTFQYLWGTQYTDEWIWIEVNGDPSASNDTNPDNTADGEASEDPPDMRYFVHQDRQPLPRRPPHSGVDRNAIPELRSVRRVKGNWNVVALTEYDTQGTNNGRIAERYSYTPYGSFIVLKGDSGSGELCSASLTSIVGNVFAHQGLPLDAEKRSYQNRRRECLTDLQRFAQRDPLARGSRARIAHVEGRNLYARVRERPTQGLDPL